MMAVYMVYSNNSPQSGRLEKSEKVKYSFCLWSGEASSSWEAKRKAADKCMGRVKPGDMAIYRQTENGGGVWED